MTLIPGPQRKPAAELGPAAVPPVLADALYGFMASHVLFACAQTGLLQLLATTEGCTAEEAAKQRGLHADATARLLAASAAIGLTIKLDGDRYAVPHALRPYLAEAGERALVGWIGHLAAVTTRTFAQLPEAVRSGELQLPRVLGLPEDGVFGALYADPARVAGFANSMWSMGFDAAIELAREAPLPARGLLVDAGGGSGAFAIAAALEHPELSAIVVDRPELAPHFARMASRYGVTRRVRFLAADLFDGDLPMADVYALGYILSDWTEAAGTRLLERVHGRLRPRGEVYVLERLFDDGGVGPRTTALMDICMLLETHGRHRSAAQYHAWLARVGFVDIAVTRSSGDKHLIRATRA